MQCRYVVPSAAFISRRVGVAIESGSCLHVNVAGVHRPARLPRAGEASSGDIDSRRSRCCQYTYIDNVGKNRLNARAIKQVQWQGRIQRVLLGGGGRIMASAGAQAYMGVWGLAPSGVQEQSPWSGGRSPLEADAFL